MAEVTIRVGNVKSIIEELDDIQIIDAISKVLTYRLDSAKFSWKFKSGQWDGTSRLLTKSLGFPTGCLSTVTAILDIKKISYKLIDTRNFYDKPPQSLDWRGYDLYPYQNSIVDVAMDKKSGMVKACTGAGKTEIIARMIYEFNLPTVIYVVSLDLLTQMHSTLERCLGIPVGLVGNGVCDIKNITVCSAWTAGRVYSSSKELGKELVEEDVSIDKWAPSSLEKNDIKNLIEGAKVVILDEAQFAAASSIRAILNHSKSAAYKYGFSGTPWRSGGDDLLLEAAFGPNICDLKATQLIREGYLAMPKIAFRDIKPPKIKLNKQWKDIKSQYIIENEERNDVLIRNVVRLLEMGRKPLVLFREHKHGRIIRDLLPPDIKYEYVTGEVSAESRDKIRDDFKRGRVNLILASTVYDQGIDLPALDALVLAGGGKSTAKALQRIGRVIRGNPSGGKVDALVVETFDQAHYVRDHAMMRYHIYKTEPAFQVKMGPAMTKYIKKYGK